MQTTITATDNWLDGGSLTTTGQSFLGSASSTISWPNSNYYYHVCEPSRPIRLTLAEVEQLRKAAKSDAKLKDVLKKFTSQIEVIVSLD